MAHLYKESYTQAKGRLLVAAEDISAGETVLQDECLVSGPDGLPVCLGCLGPLGQAVFPCEVCSWPLCRLIFI